MEMLAAPEQCPLLALEDRQYITALMGITSEVALAVRVALGALMGRQATPLRLAHLPVVSRAALAGLLVMLCPVTQISLGLPQARVLVQSLKE